MVDDCGSDSANEAHGSARSALRIFVSYRRADSPGEVHLLRDRLIGAGFSREHVFVDVEQKAGVNYVEEIQRAVDDCDALIVVVGPHWLDAADPQGRRLDDPRNWSRREIESALDRGVAVIPVLVADAGMPDPDQLPGTLVRFADLHAMKLSYEPADHQRLAARLDEIAEGIATTRISNLREPNPSFVGRDALLNEIKDTLGDVRSGGSIVAVVGLPAYGKTQLAVHYAHRHRDDYRIVWEVPAEQRATCRERFGGLSRLLKLPPRHDHDHVDAVRTALEQSSDWLLILDNAKNAQDIEDIVPRSGGHVLITSQRASWDELDAATVQIDVMTQDDAVALLRKRVQSENEADLIRLADELMRIPLALEQASSYMRPRHMAVSDYLALFREHSRDLLDRGAVKDYERTLGRAWRLALSEVERTAEETAPGAVELLNLCAFLGPDDIPLSTFEAHAEALPEPLATVIAHPLSSADAVGLLADYSHLKWNDDGKVGSDSVSLHRTVQHFARERLEPDDQRKWCAAAVSIVLAAFPDDPSDVGNWDACGTLLPHATAALGQADGLGIEPLYRGRLLDRIGVFLQSGAQFAEAQEKFESALELLDDTDSEQAGVAATVRNHLGSLQRELGDFESAYANHSTALVAHEAICGPGSREVAEDRLNLGHVLIERDDLAGASDQIEQALRIRTELNGPNHHTVAECLTALFTLHLRSGNVLDARSRLTSARAVYQALGREKHPVAVWLGFIDNHLFGVEADPAGTHSGLEEVVAVTEEAFGASHPELAEWTLWLADSLLREASLDRAEAFYIRALEIDERAYGGAHWKVARDLLRIFLIQAARDESDDARQTLLRAIRILQQVSTGAGSGGSSHHQEVPPFVLAKFDDALDVLGAISAVVAPVDRIGTIVSDSFGRETPLYGSALEHLALELQETGRHDYLEYGRDLLAASLSIFVKHYGKRHVRVARCLRHLGAAQAALGDADGAAVSFEEALSMLDSDARPNQIELMHVLTGLYPVLAGLEKRASVRAVNAANPHAPTSSSAIEESGRSAAAILARTRGLATSAVGVGPLVQFAETLFTAGILDQALEIQQQVLGMLEEAYGHDSPLVATSLKRTGSVHEGLGDFAAALECYDRALAIHRTHTDLDHHLVAEGLRHRARALAGLGDSDGATEDLERSFAMLERIDGSDVATLAQFRVEQWLALADAAADPDAARALYERALDRTGGISGPAPFRARLGGVAAVQGDVVAAIDHFWASIRADRGPDPFWTVVRAATPAAHTAADRKRLVDALRTLREDPSMQEHLHNFRPQLTAAKPNDWFAKESMTLLAPDGQANVIASGEQLDPEMDTREYAEVQGKLLRDEFPAYEELGFEENTDHFGGRRAFIRQFEWTPPDGVRVSQIQIYYAENGRGYTATATTPTSRFPAIEVELRQVLLGLSIGP